MNEQMDGGTRSFQILMGTTIKMKRGGVVVIDRVLVVGVPEFG